MAAVSAATPIDQVHVVRGGELLGDLKAGVAATDDEHRPGRDVPPRPAIRAAVELDDVPVESIGHRGTGARNLERAGGDHHLVRFVGAVVELDHVAVIAPVERLRTGLSSSTGSSKLARVVGEVGDDVVAAGVRVRAAGERLARAGCRSARGVNSRSESQRLAPRRRRLPAASRIVKLRPCWESR